MDGGFFAAIALDLVLDALSVVEGTKTGSFNSRDVNKHVLAALHRSNAYIPLSG
jgi:hypothetical protein